MSSVFLFATNIETSVSGPQVYMRLIHEAQTQKYTSSIIPAGSKHHIDSPATPFSYHTLHLVKFCVVYTYESLTCNCTQKFKDGKPLCITTDMQKTESFRKLRMHWLWCSPPPPCILQQENKTAFWFTTCWCYYSSTWYYSGCEHLLLEEGQPLAANKLEQENYAELSL
jgi:hypothetical protein